MKKAKMYSTNRFILPLMFIAFSIIFEIANFLILGFKTADGGLIVIPQYFLFDIAVILMMASFLFFLQHTAAISTFFYLFLFIQFGLNLCNATMYTIFGDILTIDLAKLGTEGAAAAEAGFIDWLGSSINVLLFAIFVTASALLLKFNKSKFCLKNFSYAIFALAICILGTSSGLSFMVVGESTLSTSSAESEVLESDKYLWDNLQFKADSYIKFGHFGFYAKYFGNFILNNKISENEKNEIIKYMQDGKFEENKEAPLYDQNLIVILCESMDTFAIDPINTPTLWALANGEKNSISFNQFHARNRTNFSEGLSLIGNMPREIMLNDSLTNGFSLNYSLPNMFKNTSSEKETVTTYIHALDNFYSRNVTHGAGGGIGFDRKYSINNYTGSQEMKPFHTWISDLEFTQNMIDYFLPDTDRFLTYFSSLSTHGPYSNINPYFTEYYQTFDENFEEYKSWLSENTLFEIPQDSNIYSYFRHYKASFIDFDKTVEFLIKTLEDRGLSETTSILFFGDHNAYYYNLCNEVKDVPKDDFSNLYINNVPMFIYSPALTKNGGQVVDTFCNTYDIVPTLVDLYGLPGNKNWFQGYSIFSDEIENSFFSSNLSGMFDANFFCTTVSDIKTNNTDATKEDLAAFKTKVNTYYKRQAILNKIYKFKIKV